MDVHTPIDTALAILKASIIKLPQKRQEMLIKWIIKWSRYLSLEDTFKPEFIPRYKRGDIVYVDFGFNVGNEYGGVHYAAILETDNRKSNGTVIVLPLTSLKAGKTTDEIPYTDLFLGSDVIPWTAHDNIAKLTQIRAVSKMRIIKPLKKGDKRARLKDEHLDMIDNRVKQMLIKECVAKN